MRATRGVSDGTWFCEWTIPLDSKAGGHVRLGWANDCADAHAAVGFDQHSYAIRDVNGSRVHQSIRTHYGRAFSPGDVVGCLIAFNTPAADLRAAEQSDAGPASAGPADGARVRQAQAASARAPGGATRSEVEAILFQSAPPGQLPWSQTSAGSCSSSSGGSRGGIAGGDHSAAYSEGGASAYAGYAAAAAAAAGGALLPGRLAPHSSSGGSSSSSSGSDAWRPGDPIPRNDKHVVNARHWGSSIRFYVNGEDQGTAFVHLTRETKYFPAASCYDGASVRFNPGPVFAFTPDGTSAAPAGTEGTVAPAAASATVAEDTTAAAASSAAAAAPPISTTASPAAAGAPPTPLPWPRGQWRPVSLLETDGSGGGGAGAGGEASGSLFDLLRLPYRDAREQPSLEGLQAMLAAGARKGAVAPVTFSGAATASYASSMGLGPHPMHRGAAGGGGGGGGLGGAHGRQQGAVTHRGFAPMLPPTGSITSKAAELLQRASAASAAHAHAASNR